MSVSNRYSTPHVVPGLRTEAVKESVTEDKLRGSVHREELLPPLVILSSLVRQIEEKLQMQMDKI